MKNLKPDSRRFLLLFWFHIFLIVALIVLAILFSSCGREPLHALPTSHDSVDSPDETSECVSSCADRCRSEYE